SLDYVLEDLDLVMLMSVNPGFGGQSFIPSTLDKARALKARIVATGKEIGIEIDGGVSPATIEEISAAGVNIFVAGSAIFGADDYRQAITALKAKW
nr:ribulose-phosphate 3-epimerase [Spirochaetales bacterium]